MRLLIALLALLSGLSAPQVALAASRTEVAGQVASERHVQEADEACTVRAIPSRTFAALRVVRTVRLPLAAPALGHCGTRLSDRARE